MHCPQCGQQQVSNELRFCSRCGFPLGGVIELVANGGVLPQYQAPSAIEKTPKASPRRKGVQQGAALVFLAAVLTPLFAVLYEYLRFPEIFVALSAVIGFIGGTLRVIYALIFEEGAQKIVYLNPNTQQPLFSPYQQAAPQPRPLAEPNRARPLPPQTATPAQGWRRPDTAELVNKPPSVTENTTKLLDIQDKEEPH
ncbi:MAG TPA: hypothetical protein VEQ40_05475 [Pyrinomonadaceae bacterium]|nr:hypothetical protein [Pyrinomonadaceae bacterium]